MTQNPITQNTLRNAGTQLNTMPVPINFPHLSIQVRLFSGIGTGGPKKPQGHPCPSLAVLKGSSSLLSVALLLLLLSCASEHAGLAASFELIPLPLGLTHYQTLYLMS